MKEKKQNTDGFEIRAISEHARAFENEGKRFVEGYASVFDQKSKLIRDWVGSYYEIISRGAFDEVLRSENLDVIYTPNHDYDKVIARTKSGTLKLEVDERGLKYTAEIPNISYANDLYESIKRGDIFESSFTFWVDDKGQTWSEDESGNDVRTITKVMNLREVASVTWGAYANTEVEARGHKEFVESKQKPEPEPQAVPLDIYKRKLHLKKLQ